MSATPATPGATGATPAAADTSGGTPAPTTATKPATPAMAFGSAASATASTPTQVAGAAQIQEVRTLCEQLAATRDYEEGVRVLDRLRQLAPQLQQFSGGYQHFLQLVVPAVSTRLRAEPVTLDGSSKLQAFRRALLETLQSLPMSEPLRPYVATMLDLATALLETENEPNTIACIKLIIDLYKNCRPPLKEQVQRFLLFVQRIFSEFPTTAASAFAQAAAPGPESDMQRTLTAQTQAEQQQLAIKAHVQQLQLQVQQAYTHVQEAMNTLHQTLRAYNLTKQQVVSLEQAVRTTTGAEALAQQRARLTDAQARLTSAHGQHVKASSTHQQAQARHSQIQLQLQQAVAQLAQAHADFGDAKAVARTAREAYMRSVGAGTPAAASAEDGSKPLLESIRSFKVLTECPIVVVLLFQLYNNDKSKEFVQNALPSLVPLTIAVLSYSPAVAYTQAFRETHKLLVAAQVKTLSFLAYVLNRGFTDSLRTYHEQLPAIVMQLLRSAPADSVAIRKELLIAARHILASDLRAGFVQEIDQLMDERVLIGSGWTCREMLRPLAYSTLADLVHHIRQDITTAQLSRAVHLFLRNIQDNSLPLTIQTMSCKLILNLVEVLARRPDPSGGTRSTLLHILSGFTSKMGSLAKWQLPRIVEHHKQAAAKKAAQIAANENEAVMAGEGEMASGPTGLANSASASAMDTQEDTTCTPAPSAAPGGGADAMDTAADDAEVPGPSGVLPGSWEPLKSRQFTDFHIDSVKDLRFLVKNLTHGLKTIIWGIATCNTMALQTAAGDTPQPTRLLASEELFLLLHLLRNGLDCFAVYGLNLDGSPRSLQGSDSYTAKPSPEERECIDALASMFTMVDVVTFREVFQAKIGHLVSKIFDNNLLLTIPQHILSNRQVSTFFAPSLLAHLVELLPTLGNAGHNVPMVTLRLFKLVFGSVSLFANQNEVVLQPHLAVIVHRSMELSTTAEQPVNYLLLLRALFRSIGGGKFELLYREFLPLLPALLNGLTRLQEGAHRQQMRDLFVELCLTVPVRLSALLPYLHYLMRPLVLALNSGDELVGQGLRTLELCIDNLTPEFLYPVIYPVRGELMQALWQHLKPNSPLSPHGQTTLRVLGKLGGRNRSGLTEPPSLEPQNPRGSALRLTLPFSSAGTAVPPAKPREIKVPVDSAVHVAMQIIGQNQSKSNRREAFVFLRSCLVAMLDLRDGGALATTLTKCHVASKSTADLRLYAVPHYKRDTMKGDANHVLGMILQSMFIAAADPALAQEAAPFLEGTVRHFVLVGTRRHPDLPAMAPAAHPVVDEDVIVEAMAASLCGEDRRLADVTVSFLRVFVDSAATVMGSLAEASRLPLFAALVHEICACCYRREWYCKSGGCKGIEFLIDNMPLQWVIARQVKINKALLFAIVDLSNGVGGGVVTFARQLSTRLIRKCCQEGPWELVQPPAQCPAGLGADGPETVDTPLGKMMKLLSSELSSPDSQVRDHVKELLGIVSEVSGMPPASLLQHTSLRGSLIPKTGRNTPVNTQIGRMDALTYALTIDPPLVEFSPSEVAAPGQPDNTTYFTEVSQICRLDDNTARQAARPNAPFSPQMITALRHRGLDLLAATQRSGAWSAFAKQTAEILVRSLVSDHEEIVASALGGLRAMDMQRTLAKEDLQAVLRILLDNLGDYRKLSVPLLRSLGCMVDVARSCFNEKLGDKLFEHLVQWLHRIGHEVTGVAPMWRDSDSVAVAAAVVEVLPKLGATSVKFLGPLVESVLTAETRLGRQVDSAFRLPLLHFFNAFPGSSLDYLYARLSSTAHARVLLYALDHASSDPLRTEAFTRPQVFIDAFRVGPDGGGPATRSLHSKIAASQVLFTALSLLRCLTSRQPAFLRENAGIVANIRELWHSDQFQTRLQQQELVSATRVNEPLLLAKLLIDYLRVVPEDVDVMFTIVSLFSYRTLADASYLWTFLYRDLPASCPVPVRRSVLHRVLDILPRPTQPEIIKVQAIEKLALPLACTSIRSGDGAELFAAAPEAGLPQGFLQRLRDVMLTPAEAAYGDSLKMAILQLLVACLQGARDSADVRAAMLPVAEDYAMFAWTHAFLGTSSWSLEDTSVRYAGCVAMCLVVEVFGHDDVSVMQQVYARLVAGCGSESRRLVLQGIDILVPLLARNMGDGAGWIATTRQAVTSENHQQCQHAWSIIVRQQASFYPHRQALMRPVIDSLVRLGQQSNSQLESRTLAVSMVEMIISWEQRAIREASHAGEVTSVDGDTASMEANVPRQSHEMLYTFLIHTAIQVVDRPSAPESGEELAGRCMRLLEQVLTAGLWASANVSVSRFDNLLLKAPVDPQPNQNFASFATALQVLVLVVRHLPLATALHKIGQLRQGLTKASQCRHTTVATAFRQLLEAILKLYPYTVQTGLAAPGAQGAGGAVNVQLQELYRQLHVHITDGLAAFDRGSTNTGLYVTLSLLTVFCEHTPRFIVEFTGVLVKVVQRLQKDHLAATASGTTSTASAPQLADDSLNLLVMCVELMAPQLAKIEAHPRKLFLGSITTLLEKSHSAPLMQVLVRIIGAWATAPAEKSVLPIKERAALMYKAQNAFARRFAKDAVFNTFLDVLLDIFAVPALANTELTQRLEAGFMMGLRSRDLDMRERFFALYDRPNAAASLHDRLNYVFNEKCQKWDTSKHSFWVKHCVDIVLAGADPAAPVCPSSSVCRIRPLVPANHVDSVAAREARVTPELEELLATHAAFLEPLRSTHVSSVAVAMRTLCHVSPHLAHSLWIELFPLLWQILDDAERLSVGQSLRTLLQQEYHHDQALLRPNNVNALVTGVSRCTQPMLALPASLLYHLSKTHNLWHTGIYMLYHQQLRAEARGEKVTDGKLEPIKDTLADLYLQLHEDDMWFGMWRLRSKLQKTTKALAWEQQGYWQQAQAGYEDVIRSAQTEGVMLRDAEFQLWEERWQGCTARLGQDELLVRYGEEVKHQPIVMQAACNLRNWKKLKETMTKLEHQRDPSAELKIYRAYLTIATADEQNVGVVEKACHDAAQLALQEWISLPTPVSHAHVPLLQMFQRIVELQESAQLLSSMQPANAGRLSTQDLNTTLETWRNRLPNDWDDILAWQDILNWRVAVFDKISQVVRPATAAKDTAAATTTPTFAQNEISWTLSTLARVAREQKLGVLCHRTLNKVYRLQNVPVTDMFAKVREQIWCEMLLNPLDCKAQLEIINSTNLTYFKPRQSAEVFALKAAILHRKGDYDEANKTFSAALSVCDDLAYGWLAWSLYCDHMLQLASEAARAQQGATAAQVAAAATQVRDWGVAAMTCGMNALRSTSEHHLTTRITGRSLMLLAMDEDPAGAVGQVFSRLAETVDPAVWRPWIPQLLTCFSRPEARHVLPVIIRVAKQSPQAIYYSLRTTFLELRQSAQAAQQWEKQQDGAADAETGATLSRKRAESDSAAATPKRVKREHGEASSKGMTSTEGAGSMDTTPDVPAAKEAGDAGATRANADGDGKHEQAGDGGETAKASSLHTSQPLQHTSTTMHHLRSKHPMLATAMESMIDEIMTRFKPTPAEELLRTTQVLLTECLKQAFAVLDRSLDGADVPVPPQVQMHLSRLLQSFFTPANVAMAQYKKKFEEDFSGLGQMTLDTCLTRLHQWHRNVGAVVARMSKTLRLEDMSRFLTNFSATYSEVDIPGEYLERRPSAQAVAKIERFLPDVQIVHKHSAAFRRINIRGRNGQTYPFLVQHAPSRHARTEERLIQLFRMLNTLLDMGKQAHKRNLQFLAPHMVPLSQLVRLVAYDPSCISLEEVFMYHCEANNMTMDQPVIHFYEARRNDLRMRAQKKEVPRDLRKDIFDHIRRVQVPSDILSRFARISFNDHTSLWMFKRQFTNQLALTAFAMHVLRLNKGAPHTLKLVLSNGNIMPWELAPVFDTTGNLCQPDRVPFRLTPNLVNFVTPVGITGLFSSAMLASAQAIHDPELHVGHYIGGILRDELISWHAVHHGPYLKSGIANADLVTKVEGNVAIIEKQLGFVANFEGNHGAVDSLIKAATASQNLSLMSPTWQPWL